jgi:hypothetical protein
MAVEGDRVFENDSQGQSIFRNSRDKVFLEWQSRIMSKKKKTLGCVAFFQEVHLALHIVVHEMLEGRKGRATRKGRNEGRSGRPKERRKRRKAKGGKGR